jgi:hypothetical protein
MLRSFFDPTVFPFLCSTKFNFLLFNPHIVVANVSHTSEKHQTQTKIDFKTTLDLWLYSSQVPQLFEFASICSVWFVFVLAEFVMVPKKFLKGSQQIPFCSFVLTDLLLLSTIHI